MKPLARLGEVMHLNGTVPRGADLRTALPRYCRGCRALFIVFGKGSARAAYCPDCRTNKCRICNHAGGQHYPYCSSLKPRRCRDCGADLGHSGRLICATCRATACPECGVRGGRHRERCRYTQRRRRPGLTTRYGVVSEQEILDLYLAHRAQAVRLVYGIVGAEAEDVVHDVITYLLEKRDYLPHTPGARYFFTAVKHTALRRLLYAWARYVVAVDPAMLILIEQIVHPSRRLRPNHTVRLPEPVA